MRSVSRLPIFASLALSLTSALVLSFESYLETQNASLCKTEACELVGQALRINESLLVMFGAAFFWLLAGCFFFVLRYPQQIRQLPLFLLLPALAFDGALIGFQVFSLHQACALCLTVAALLLIVATVYCLAQNQTVTLSICLLAWFGGFSANSIIKMPEPVASRAEMIFFTQSALPTPQNRSKIEITLLFSLKCPHCLEIISLLAEQKPKNITVNLASIDQDQESLQKLGYFIEQSSATDNPFQLIKDLKTSGSSFSKNPRTLQGLKHHSQKALSFLANTGYTSIPLLIARTSENEERFFLGSEAIFTYLQSIL